MTERKPRVLLVSPDFPPQRGGIQTLLERLAASAQGIDFRVLTLGQEGAAEFDRDSGLDVRRVASATMNRQLAGLGLNLASVWEAARFRPDAILSGHVIASLGALALRRTLRVPLIQYVHADEFRGRPRLAGTAVRGADLTIAVSAYTRGMVLAAGADPARVRVIHPGVDVPPLSAEPRSQQPTILTVARMLFRYKGHDVLTRSLPLVRAKVPDARWVVIGDGPYRPTVEAAVSAYGLDDAVEFLGAVDDEERGSWLARSTVFCMPSRVPPAGVGGEGFGIVYLEAAAAGLPAIGGRTTGASDAVVDGETGLLIDPLDHLELAAALTGMLSDRERTSAMGVAARNWAERHEWARIAAEVEAAIRETIGLPLS